MLEEGSLAIKTKEVTEDFQVCFSKVYDGVTTLELLMPCHWPQNGAKIVARTEEGAELASAVEEFNKSDMAEASLAAAIGFFDAKVQSVNPN